MYPFVLKLNNIMIHKQKDRWSSKSHKQKDRLSSESHGRKASPDKPGKCSLWIHMWFAQLK